MTGVNLRAELLEALRLSDKYRHHDREASDAACWAFITSAVEMLKRITEEDPQ